VDEWLKSEKKEKERGMGKDMRLHTGNKEKERGKEK
jgi:hypothetical protein